MRWAGVRVRLGLGRILGRGQRPAPARILVADDDQVIRQLIAVHLTAAGFTVIQAASGRMALELAGNARVVAAVLDAGMPTPTGWDVARELRANSATATVRTVVLWPEGSGDASPALHQGADACLAKPFNPPELVTLVAALTGCSVPGQGVCYKRPRGWRLIEQRA